ncbi:pituitary tumor-transforming gene 1 protein-interacting protein-like isoform X2 [Tubulanus polymorphus]|uniref:pituitary tumor-transforming gene 1 protein-interacting protein-like isoform X2 n=1 Tax=Tubulanus polymorphus TaxID=672921 RepID=UPI003DA2EA33
MTGINTTSSQVSFFSTMISWFVFGLVILMSFSASFAQITTSAPPTTTLTPTQVCAKYNGSCDDCVRVAECMYCYKGNKCVPYPVGHILPSSDDCPLDYARWGTCLVNFKVLLIVMGVLAGVILISTCCCIYCCCCRKKRVNKKYKQEEEKWEREREERRQKAEERKAERKVKADEIRRKYGMLTTNSEDTEALIM